MVVKNWYEVTVEALKAVWFRFVGFLPNLIGAVIIIIIGWFVALGIGRLISEILKKIKIDKIFEQGKWKKALEKAGWKVSPSAFIGAIVKWVIFIAFLLAAVETLGFVAFASFLSKIVAWLPNVIVAAAIFVVAVIAIEYIPKIIRAATEGIGVKYSNFLEAIVKFAIWIFAIVAILVQLGIAKEIILTLFKGFVAFLVIAGGLAFGLGGKEAAGRFLEDLSRKLKE